LQVQLPLECMHHFLHLVRVKTKRRREVDC
jgi:hypothetical protein